MSEERRHPTSPHPGVHARAGSAPPGRHAGNLPREGGRLCLDFVNTLDWRGTPTPHEHLAHPAALVAWCAHTGLLAAGAVASLQEGAAAQPDAAAAVLDRARTLREALYGLFRAGWDRGAPLSAHQAVLNAELAAPAAGWRFVLRPEGWRWAPEHADAAALAGLLRPIAASAAELLASPETARVKPCGDAACGWVFLDTSRNATRRWCNMATCGNRAKARRHYRRRREGGAASAP